jgi:IS605 OrfB family transposase
MADGRDAPHATFVRPDVGSFCRLDELGLQVVGTTARARSCGVGLPDRRDHHQLSTTLIRDNQAVAVEDLAVKGLARTRMAKSVHDAGWSAFVAMLEYKARLYGREFHRIGRFIPTSQTCSACGARDGPKPLHVRAWQCQECGAWLDRDINAAVNVAKAAGLAVTACRAQVRPGPAPAQRSRNPPELTPPSGVTGGKLHPSASGRSGGQTWTNSMPVSWQNAFQSAA